MNRISVKAGGLEVEYQGDQAFIEEKLVDFIKQISELGGVVQDSQRSFASDIGHPNRKIELSTNTIAQTIDAKTGSDLVVSAMAKIIICNNKPTATRQEIHNEMKEASTYYKETFASNLSSYLDTLVKGKKINLVSKQNYSFPASERARLEGAISVSR